MLDAWVEATAWWLRLADVASENLGGGSADFLGGRCHSTPSPEGRPFIGAFPTVTLHSGKCNSPPPKSINLMMGSGTCSH